MIKQVIKNAIDGLSNSDIIDMENKNLHVFYLPNKSKKGTFTKGKKRK